MNSCSRKSVDSNELQPAVLTSIHDVLNADLNTTRHIKEELGVAKLVSRQTIFPSPLVGEG